MRRLQVAALATLATAAFSTLGLAQTPVAMPVDTPVQEIHLDLATGEITPAIPTGADAPVSGCFSNSAFSGFYAIPTAGTEWVDFGVKACGLSDLAFEIVIGYASTALDPGAGGPGASVNITIYSGALGFCDAKVPVANYALTGLPSSPDGVGASAFSLSVDLSSAGFILGDGPLGWGYADTDGVTGPLLISVGANPTGTIDAFDIYSPGPASAGSCAGTFAFGTPGIASFWLEIGEDDGAGGGGSEAVNTGSGCNVGVLTTSGPPAVGNTWDPSISTSAVGTPVLDFLGISTGPLPAAGCIPGIGEILISISTPNPLILKAMPTGSGAFSIPVPTSSSMIGVGASAQGGQVDGGGGGIGMTNGIDFVIGV